LERAAEGPRPRVFVGFDGFVDVLFDVVDTRTSMAPKDYAPIADIPALARRVLAAAGRSGNLELVMKEERFGGNGPLSASALAGLGARVSFAGCVDDGRFAPLRARCERVFSASAPGVTHALEFSDGKIMLNMPGPIQRVGWAEVAGAMGGVDGARREMADAGAWVFVNWSIMPGAEDIWRGVLRDVLPAVDAGAKMLFVDLSDPAKRTDADLRRAIGVLREFEACMPVTLGLNASEAMRFSTLMGTARMPTFSPTDAFREQAAHCAAALRSALNLACVAIHPREGAAGADKDRSAWVDGPFTATPKLSTGGGDHFNGGFVYARSLGMSLEDALAVGCSTSGAYVRDGLSPAVARVRELLLGAG
jgi:sugar/nucleoside kinase (ribokinase family)